MSQHFLYKVKGGRELIRIFTIKESPLVSTLVEMYPGQPNKIYNGTIEQMRATWRASKKDGWQDKAVCSCGRTYDAGWYIHIGHCIQCEYAAEEEAQRESLWLESQMDG